METKNKQYGFYGVINCFFDDESTQNIWTLMTKKLQELYPNKTEEELVSFLEARPGRHFAHQLLGDSKETSLGAAMLKIALLKQIDLSSSWMYYHMGCDDPAPVNKQSVYKNAIECHIKKPHIKQLMFDLLEYQNNSTTQDLKTWLEAESTTAQDLEVMWWQIQEKLTKRIRHGYSKHIRKEAGSC